MTIRRKLKEELQDKTRKELEKEADFEVEKFRRKLERLLASDERELVKKNPVVILEGILEASMQVFDPHLRSSVIGFINLVLQKKVLRQLFLAAIYQGAYGVRKIALEQSQQQSQPQNSHGFQYGMPNQLSASHVIVSIPSENYIYTCTLMCNAANFLLLCLTMHDLIATQKGILRVRY